MAFEIRGISREGRFNILQTLPVMPVCMNDLNFQITGLKEKIENPAEYVKACIEKKVMPYTYVELKYRNAGFEMHGNFYGTNMPQEVQSEASSLIVKGGKISRMKFETNAYAPSGFELFKKSFLNNLLENDYELVRGELWLTSRHTHSEYSLSDHVPLTKIYFSEKYIMFFLNNGFKEEEKEKFESWIEQLKAIAKE